MSRTCMSVAAILIGICTAGIAVAQEAEDTLSNADIVMLTEAGLSPSAIVVVIPAGRFRMGCVSGERCMDNEFPVHDG